MMPNLNTESDADLARNQVDEPLESAAGPAEAPEVNATEDQTPLADPNGGDAAVDRPDPSEIEQAGAPGDQPEAAGAEETAPMEQVPPAEADDEELVADRSEPVAVASAAEDEPPTAEVEAQGAIEDDATPPEGEEEELAAAEPPAADVEEAGVTGDEAAPAESNEEGLAAAAPVAAAVEGAPADEPPDAEADETGDSGIEPASVEVDEEGPAADEPSAIEAEEAGPIGDEEAPAEAEEEGLAAGAVAPAAAAGAAVDGPSAVDADETSDSGGESAPADADEEGLAADEPPAIEAEEAGPIGDEEAPAEAEEEGLAAGAVAPAAAAGAAVDGPSAVDADETSDSGGESAPADADEEGLAAAAPIAAAAAAGAVIDEPPTVEGEEAGATGDDVAPAEASEEGLAVAAPMAAAAAAGAVIDEPSAVEGEEAGEAGGEAPLPAAAVGAGTAQDLQDKKRRRLLVGLLALVALLIVAGALFVRYLLNPGPLPDLLPLPVDINYRPHYLFSVYGVDRPVGVAVSPDGERIYVTETSGVREVKVFDRGGHLLHSFSPPYTGPAERAPVYVAVGPAGRVFVTDRLQRAVFVYDRDGKLLDAILGPDLTLSEYVSKHVDGFQPDSKLAYNLFGRIVRFQVAGEGEQVLPAPDLAGWAPLGVRVDERGTMLLTDVVEGQHTVREFPGDLILASTWLEFDPPEIVFGAQGHDSGEFMYPNSAVADSKGRIYVTDGNNGRISVWDGLGSFLFDFGMGVGESALSLPRGAAMDKRDRLHIVDAVDQSVKVYDVSEPEPRFLFAFGDWGTKEGEFNYPGDIALDGTGRLYITDRENNRIQVWSY